MIPRSCAWQRVLAGVALACLIAAGVSPAGAVIGGRESRPDEAPYVAALLDETGAHFCAGTVIATNWVMTAAHCVDEAAGGLTQGLQVVTGRRDLSDQKAGKQHRVSGVVIHPKWDAPNRRFDIALVRLATPAAEPKVRLAAAGDEHLESHGVAARVYGWGSQAFVDPSSDVLRVADVPIVGDAECADQYRTVDVSGLPEFGVSAPEPAVHVCAAGPLRDACSRDSGGPLVTSAAHGDVQVGIVSYGFLCAMPTHAGVYTEVNNPEIAQWMTVVLSRS